MATPMPAAGSTPLLTPRIPAKPSCQLFEALNWAVALDQRTAAHFVPDGKPAGYAWPSRIGYGAEIMPGVRFVRNSVHHQWSDALQLRGGAFPEWRYGGRRPSYLRSTRT